MKFFIDTANVDEIKEAHAAPTLPQLGIKSQAATSRLASMIP